SVADDFDISLAKALSGREDAGEIMEQLSRTNSFMSQLHGDTYRYHHLFQDFLREKAAEAVHIDTGALHKRAALYYRNRKDYSRALRSWLDSGDYKGIDTFLYHFLFENRKEVVAQHADFLRSVFERDLPEKAFKAAPALYALGAWYYYLTGRHEEFEAHLDLMYKHLPQIAMKGGKFIEFAIAAYSTDYRTGILEKVKQFKRVERYAKLFTPNGLGGNVVSITHNMPYLHKSNVDYSGIALEEGALEQLGTTFGVLLGAEWGYMKPCLSAGFHYERNMLAAALADNTKALSLFAEGNRIEGLVCVLVLQHSILWRQSRTGEAEKALARLAETTRAKASFFTPNLAAYRARLALANGDKEAARAWLDNYFVVETGHAEMTSLYLHFTTARAHLVLGEIEKAALCIGMLKDFCKNFGRSTDACEAAILETVLLWHTGRRSEAAAVLASALESIAPLGFVRVVADEGAAILPPLKRIFAAINSETYAGCLCRASVSEMLLAAHSFAKAHRGVAANLSRQSGKPVKLSRRQAQMLALRAQGNSNPQISEITGIAIPTIKTHLFYAYQKLGVNNAMDAILRAQELGLL
ncbi:MAG: LuxR C-terminal-related transcriptional regulator, partial [Clostridiales Family XIII bacterium]|nr:LuxR C-terminal-related transcriptional regulator [Clostridiales Family XIII bacterium]